MIDSKKPGQFYLGRQYDWQQKKVDPDPTKLLLYDSRDLTTHAVCVGMTGSGKTGLCLSLLEEAALAGIPAIAIDPKGDLGNLLLTFPQLRPEDFRPWVDEGEAQRKNISPDELASQTAERWRKGLAEWGQDAARIQRFRDAVDIAIYTPGSQAGLPISVLRSFAPPPRAVLDDADALRERLVSTVSGLLALLGVEADPMRSREHILLAQILEHAWRAGRELDFPALLRAIQSPPMNKVGMVDLESFFPAKDRTALAMQLNALMASPGFSAWMEGEALDIARLLHTPQGKPRLSILYIAHLNDTERMFFVTVLLGQLLAWMRSQSGTSSLRAILYMDEVFGYFPPTANPPSKTPMLTLLKQARAYGLGIMLATQNPVDLDYKGLSNAGTWFLGRLQTERDKARVIEGLEGASAAAGASFDRAQTERILASLGNRVFLMNDVHLDQPVVFQTRWCLSYLGGPLTRVQIQKLMADRKQPETGTGSATGSASAAASRPTASTGQTRPLAPPDAGESFVRPKVADHQRAILYHPALAATARVHFVDAKNGLDQWSDVSLLAPLTDDTQSVWASAEDWNATAPTMDKEPDPQATFADLPAAATRGKSYAAWEKDLAAHLYANRSLRLWRCESVDECSRPDESESDFRTRLAPKCRQLQDAEQTKIQQKYSKKLATVEGQIQRGEQRVTREKGQRWRQFLNFLLSIVSIIASALGGRKLMSQRNISSAATAARRAGGAATQQGDVQHAQESVEVLAQQRTELQAQLQTELDQAAANYDAAKIPLTEYLVRPRKGDISVNRVALVWLPYRNDGNPVAAY